MGLGSICSYIDKPPVVRKTQWRRVNHCIPFYTWIRKHLINENSLMSHQAVAANCFLRKTRELAEIRRSLLFEGIPTFFCLVSCVIKKGSIPSHLLNTS